jgi:hypothetical protein
MAAAFGQRLAPMEVDGSGEGEDSLSCRVCLEKERQYVLHPCGHAPACGPCLDRILRDNGQCPVCRVRIGGRVRVFL